MDARGVTLLTAVVMTATSCGNGDGPGTAPPSKAAYVQRADSVCRKGNGELHAAEARFFAGEPRRSRRKEREYVLEVFVPNLEAQLAKLRPLPTPKGDQAEVNAIWDAAAAGLAELEANPGSVGGTSPAGFRTANRLAIAYGFTVCGST